MAGAVDIIDEAHAALVGCADLIDGLVDGECAGVLRSLQRMVSTVQELQRRVMDRAVLRGEWAIDGFRSPARWAAVNAEVPERTARRLRQQASSFRDLAHASSAALRGDLHDVHAEEIARCHRLAPDRFDAVIDEVFTSVACAGDLNTFASVVREWRARVEAEAAPDPDGPAAPDRGSFRLSESIEGRWFGDLELNPEDGQFVASAIDRGVGRMLQAKRDGDPALEELDVAAMRAQALVDLIDRALRLNPRRATAPDRYHVAFTFDVATYTEMAAALVPGYIGQGRGACRSQQAAVGRVPAPVDRHDDPMGMPVVATPRPPTDQFDYHGRPGRRGGTGLDRRAGGLPPWPPEPLWATPVEHEPSAAGGASTRHRGSACCPTAAPPGRPSDAPSGRQTDALPGRLIDVPSSRPTDAPSGRLIGVSSGDRPGATLVEGLLGVVSSRPRSLLPADALCDCSMYRLVLGAPSEVLDVGRAQRSWPAPMRNAIARRDGGCRYPQCTEPVAHCDVHHCNHWEHGGDTAVTNGIALCRFHHTFIHAHRWTVAMDEHQHPTFIRPDGTTYPTPR